MAPIAYPSPSTVCDKATWLPLAERLPQVALERLPWVALCSESNPQLWENMLTLTKLTLALDRNTGMEQKGQYKKLTWLSALGPCGFCFFQVHKTISRGTG